MNFLPGWGMMMPVADAAAEPFGITYIDPPVESTDNLTTYNFSNVPIGDPASNREVILAVTFTSSSSGGRTLDSATIGGVSATIHVQRQSTGLDNEIVSAIISAPLAAGTTANVSLTASNPCISMEIAAYRATGLTSSTPHDTDTGFSTFPTMSINIPEGGFLIGVAIGDNPANAFTWFGAMEVYDKANSDGTPMRISGSLDAEMSAETGRSVTPDGDGQSVSACCASFL